MNETLNLDARHRSHGVQRGIRGPTVFVREVNAGPPGGTAGLWSSTAYGTWALLTGLVVPSRRRDASWRRAPWASPRSRGAAGPAPRRRAPPLRRPTTCAVRLSHAHSADGDHDQLQTAYCTRFQAPSYGLSVVKSTRNKNRRGLGP